MSEDYQKQHAHICVLTITDNTEMIYDYYFALHDQLIQVNDSKKKMLYKDSQILQLLCIVCSGARQYLSKPSYTVNIKLILNSSKLQQCYKNNSQYQQLLLQYIVCSCARQYLSKPYHTVNIKANNGNVYRQTLKNIRK